MAVPAYAHFRKHSRFYTAALVGLAAAVAMHGTAPKLEVVVGADAFFAVYLILMTILVIGATPEKLRRLAGLGARAVFLEVDELNDPALRLYHRAGFRELSRRPNYYPGHDGGAAALVLRRDL